MKKLSKIFITLIAITTTAFAIGTRPIEEVGMVELGNHSSWSTNPKTDHIGFYILSGAPKLRTSGGSVLDILVNPLTTKGDILVSDGSGGYTRLPVGTNGYVLTAASGESLGLEWAAASAAGEVYWVAVDQDGTPTIFDQGSPEGDWVTSITHNGTGDVTVNYSASFTNAPYCSCTVGFLESGQCSFFTVGTSSSQILQYSSSGTGGDRNFLLRCTNRD